jgi:hypothetical protein
MVDHARGAGYFTMVAATGIWPASASCCWATWPGLALWALAALLWLLLTYTIFTAFTIRPTSPRWTRASAAPGCWPWCPRSAGRAARCWPRIGQPLRLELNLLARPCGCGAACSTSG